jgi:hypothetical protein
LFYVAHFYGRDPYKALSTVEVNDGCVKSFNENNDHVIKVELTTMNFGHERMPKLLGMFEINERGANLS